ncbi:multidrug ABC transporter ATP-binding protein [Bacillus xiamenensis]|uniref:ABC transporter ATP-binding protein/permease n=1 Tax=Bacillus xiamenensis TaxID=1178537 RepID=A0AAC9IG24_9BACI|nr:MULTISPECIES: ABC transporter ATP-binding protein [Bacillus]AOZ87918.1 multidrug ABC transporter ATP-binding protein [Bacillus xiamenensis]EKF34224.1 ABC transporter ATP-binding protein [Bacillus xiamenensis]MBG9911538.1 multidrug ABC transporter ATP-binding protein [Bacillus xiamenensis]MCW1837871.1 ABC transporter ATP-binding protein/permease [Bacillus xiamenensis]MCY9576541.1 ABC transporter ATP-binding protein/permease [Bacillus xiamenensis]
MGVIKRYMAFVTPYKKQIALTMVIGMIKFSIPLTLPLLLKYVIDDVIQGSGSAEEKTSTLFIIMGIMLVLFLVMRPPVEYYRQYYAQWTGSKVLFDIREKLFSHIQKLSLRYYANTRTGEIISRVINDVEQTKEFVITGLMNIWLDLMTVLIVIAIMCTLDLKLTIVSVIIFPLYALAVKYFYGRLRKLTKERSQALAEVQGHLHERVQGMPVIRSFAIEEYEQENFHDENQNFLNKAINHTNWNAKTFAVVNTITDIAPLLIIAFAGYTVINGSLSIGTMIAFVGYIDRMYNPIRRLINSSTTLTQSVASMDRIFEFIDEPYEVTDRPNAKEANHLKGEVEFKNVSFRYEHTQEEILHNISLKVEKGQTVALVGMSGGGKSTLVSLIPRFYDVTSGSLEIDGIDIKEYKARSLRNQVGMVLQDTFLFSDTIKENIAVGDPEASFENIVSAAKAANAHEFIMSLPEGYDTKVGERGVKLSGGQKQRISIARVFLKNPPLLILDEATSALDLESEHYIQEAMQKLAKDRTTFIVAHRLSTITHADQIVVMEKGEIVEKGTHEELMNRDSHYRHLFTIQTLN